MQSAEDQVVNRLTELNGGDRERAEAWYWNQPLPELGGGTAAEFVAHGKLAGILRYIENLSAGSTG